MAVIFESPPKHGSLEVKDADLKGLTEDQLTFVFSLSRKKNYRRSNTVQLVREKKDWNLKNVPKNPINSQDPRQLVASMWTFMCV